MARLRAMVVVSAVLAVVALAATLVVGFTDAPQPTQYADIDRAAQDAIAPADSVVDVRQRFGAKGDGTSDDTAAIQRAISSGLGFSSDSKVLYFPAGVYRITRPLEWRTADGKWSTWLTLLGQNRDRSVIELAPSSPGFGNPGQPRSMITTGSEDAIDEFGSGNQAFHNSIENLTLRVASGNAGANGVDYLANNRGVIRNVVVEAAPGSGFSGISMTRRYPGPCLLQNVSVRGFSTGIDVSWSEYGITAEHIRLSDQRNAGVRNMRNVVTIRDLVSSNSVPAVVNGRSEDDGSVLVLTGAELREGSPATAAIVDNGSMSAAAVVSTGYAADLSHDGVEHTVGPGRRFVASAGSSSTPVADDGGLPVMSPPNPPVPPEYRWRAVAADGAMAGDDRDDTASIQATLDSGAQVVYLKAGRYTVNKTLEVPSTVKRIIGFDATLYATEGRFAGTSDAPVLRISGETGDLLEIRSLFFMSRPTVVDFRKDSPRPVSIVDVHTSGVAFEGPAPGLIFLTNVDGGDGWNFSPGQQVWARQFDVERPFRKVRNDGAQLWVLGLKTEGPDTAITSTGGARTQVVGGLLYPASLVAPGTPAFVAVDASFSATIAESAYDPRRAHRVVFASTRDGVVTDVPATALPRRGGAGFVALDLRGP